MNKNKKRVVIGATVAALALSGTGVAYAYWTQGGSGTGTAATGTTSDITVVQTSSVSGLRPGTNAVLSGKFNNPNAGSVTISGVTAEVLTVTNGFSDPLKDECTADNYTITGSAAGSVVPSGNGQGAWTGLIINMVDKAGVNQDNCKGATANITYTVTP